jgi:plastocyanin
MKGLLVALGVLAAGRAIAAAPARPGQAALVQVQVRNFMFEPMQLKVPVGTTVTWVNQDDEPHTIVSDAGLFHSSALDTGMSFAFRFDRPGTYHVICSIHPQMSAIVVVE